MPVVGVQCDDLILTGLDRQQRHIHAILHAYDDILSSGAGLNDDASLDAGEFSCGDTHAIAFHQPIVLGCVERQDVAVGFGHPHQVGHLLIGKVGIVCLVGAADAGQEIVLGQILFHPVYFGFRSMDEDIIVKQRTFRLDERTFFLADLDIRRGEILEYRFSVSSAAFHLQLEFFGGISPMKAFGGYGQGQHIPSYGIAVLSILELSGNMLLPTVLVVFRGIHIRFRRRVSFRITRLSDRYTDKMIRYAVGFSFRRSCIRDGDAGI